jgi:hypothetical protein
VKSAVSDGDDTQPTAPDTTPEPSPAARLSETLGRLLRTPPSKNTPQHGHTGGATTRSEPGGCDDTNAVQTVHSEPAAASSGAGEPTSGEAAAAASGANEAPGGSAFTRAVVAIMDLPGLTDDERAELLRQLLPDQPHPTCTDPQPNQAQTAGNGRPQNT